MHDSLGTILGNSLIELREFLLNSTGHTVRRQHGVCPCCRCRRCRRQRRRRQRRRSEAIKRSYGSLTHTILFFSDADTLLFS